MIVKHVDVTPVSKNGTPYKIHFSITAVDVNEEILRLTPCSAMNTTKNKSDTVYVTLRVDQVTCRYCKLWITNRVRSAEDNNHDKV